MDSLDSWNRFVTRRRDTPLTFLSGFRQILKSDSCCPIHSHRAIEIVYHPSGRGVTRLQNSEAVRFAEGSVVVYAPEERHDQLMACNGEDLCVQLGVPANLRGVPRQCFSVERVDDPTVIDDLRRLSQAHVEPAPAEQVIFNLRATATLYALVHRACMRHEENDLGAEKYVQKAEQFIRDHFDSPITLRDAAEHAGIGYDHLRHVVRAQRGRSLVRYLTEVRVERAKTLLVHSQLPLKQIASTCGFRDEYYFSAVFRKLAGCPPGRYRAQRS